MDTTSESGCRYLGTAAMFSAQTSTRRRSDPRDRVQRAAPHADRERAQIEAQLKYETLQCTVVDLDRAAVPRSFTFPAVLVLR